MKRGVVAAGLAGIVVGAALTWLVTRSPAPEPASGTAGHTAASPVGSEEVAVRAPARELFGVAIPAAAHGPRPASLRGTAVAGSVSVDAAGHFVPTVGVRRLFDYFLSASGEEPLDVIRGRILLHLHEHLREPAASEAAAFLDDYLGLRAAAAELAAAGEVPESLERRLQWMRELRREHLGAVAARALFGEEERLVLVEIERRAVLADPDLSPERRAEALAALEERLPERVREARRRAALPAELREQVDSLRAAGASEQEVFRAREEQVGAEAAERLAELDARRAAWTARLEDYRAERDALRADPDLGEGERERAVEELRREHFEGGELERVRALDAGT